VVVNNHGEMAGKDPVLLYLREAKLTNGISEAVNRILDSDIGCRRKS
jgi:hypothetical protein